MSNSPMTAFAQAALAVSDLLAAKFAGTKFGGSVPRVVKVQAPQGPSTGGGKKARESIVLMPESGDSSQALTAGFIDVGLRAVELRTFEAVAGPYKERFGRVLDLPKPEYEKFIGELKSFLGGEGYVIKMVDADAAAAKAQGLPVVAVANYMGPFPLAMRGDPAALAPTLTVLGQTDGLVSAVQTAEVAAALNGRGARIEVHVAPERRVCTTDLVLAASAPGEPERLLAQLARLGVVDAAGARTVFVSDPVIDRADMAALGQVLAPLGATARDVLNELLIAWGAHQMRSDFGGRQLEFFEAALAARK